jgi:hypothetical protein
MTDDVRREIILAVSRGELTPEEAAARLEAAEATALPPPSRPALEGRVATPEPAPVSVTVTKVRVESDFGSLRIYGDASVAGAVANGPHLAEQEGSTLVIRNSVLDAGLGSFVFGRGRSSRVRINIGGRTSDRTDDRVEIRMNPRLALELGIKAGDVRVDGVEGEIDANVTAGSIRIEGFRAPIKLVVKAGEVRARGLLDRGESTIRCQAGQVRLDLERGSSVKIRATSTLGTIDFDEQEDPTTFVGGGLEERVIGGGTGTLDISSTLGEVRVRAER